MIFDRKTSLYTLASGRTFYANHGILGLSVDGGGVDGEGIAEGYDGGITTDGSYLPFAGHDADTLRQHSAWTQAERDEVADEMIQRWMRFKDVG